MKRQYFQGAILSILAICVLDNAITSTGSVSRSVQITFEIVRVPRSECMVD